MAFGSRLGGLSILLVAFNFATWTAAIVCFRRSPLLLGTALLADNLGLRHAVDADHIGSIEVLGLAREHLNLTGRLWNLIMSLNSKLGLEGFALITVFVAIWGFSIALNKWRVMRDPEIPELEEDRAYDDFVTFIRQQVRR